MQFVIMARDSKAPGTLDRRMVHRAEHLDVIQRMKADGTIIEAGALLDDDGAMAGSIIICEFASRNELDAYVEREIYHRAAVWSDIQILPFRRAPWHASA